MRGERDQFAILVARYGVVAKRTALLYGAGADADDVVQEAFVAAYRALARFRTGDAFRPWLLRIVINQTHNQTRGRRRVQNLIDRAAAVSVETVLHDAPTVGALSAERRKLLVTALAAMRAADRDVLTMRYLLDLSEAETATALNLAKGTVKSRTARALDRLRTELSGSELEVGIADE
jgi:RNA polymerase sigma-70 factor, ECF subfamily